MDVFTQRVTILGLLDLIMIVEEALSVLSLVSRACKDVSRDARRTAILHVFISVEDIDTTVFESDCLSQTLLLKQIAL